MTINRYYEMILSDIDFRALVNYVDLNEYDCMYQAIGVDIEKYPEFEDEDIDMLYRLFISEERWQKEKSDYILNIKSNKKYEYIEEEISEESTEPIINDIFDMSKVEII